MTVYVVNRNKDDVSDAERFGQLKYVNFNYVYPDQVDDEDRMPRAVMDGLRDCAQKFDQERDFLLIVGDHLQLVAFASMLGFYLGEENKPCFKVLRFDRQEGQYYPVTIDIA